MKYLLTILVLASVILHSSAQKSFTSITNLELQDLGNGQGLVKITLKSNELEKLPSLKIQLTGNRIPRGTYVMTLKGGVTMTNSDQTQKFELEGKLMLAEVDESKENETTYEIKDDALTKYRKLEPGQVIYFPPIEKAE